MKRKLFRVALIALALVTLGATAFAQRSGIGQFFGFGSRYSGNTKYDGKFTFVRVSYNDPYPNRQGGHWSHDYPDGEAHFLKILAAVTNVDARLDATNVMNLDDPDIFKFPVIYMCEPGLWNPPDTDIKALHDYLIKGGFLIFDDFGDGQNRSPRGQWANLDLQMARVFPDLQWIEIDGEHPIFHSFFEFPEPHQIPQHYDFYAYPKFRAWFEDNDPTKRMYAFANYDTDISEFWETSDRGTKLIDDTNEAFKLGVNEFVYGILH